MEEREIHSCASDKETAMPADEKRVFSGFDVFWNQNCRVDGCIGDSLVSDVMDIEWSEFVHLRC